MEVIQPNEFYALQTENVIVIYKSDSEILALADVEYWEECPEIFYDDPYRINYFHRDMLGQDWILNNDNIQKDGILAAFLDKCGKQCGSIYFAHEEDRYGKNVYEELHEQFIHHNPTLLIINEFESRNIHELPNGMYFLIVDDSINDGIMQ